MAYPKGWEKVSCYDWCEDENKIWLCLRDKNAICEIDEESGETKIFGSFPHNGLGEGDYPYLFRNMMDMLFFAHLKRMV